MLTAGEVKRWARDQGFVACGIAHLEPTPHADVLDQWLAQGRAGTMRYLHRQARKRKEPAGIVPGARVAVVVLENYLTPESVPSGKTASVRIAKYARGEDYHRALTRRLEQLAAYLKQHGAQQTRVFVDAGPVPERELAQRAGLGWIGKNTMLIRPGVGSFCFIGSVFTDLDLLPDAPFELDRCGSCTRCLEACPTRALVDSRELDATLCLSYLTIEYRGVIPDQLAAQANSFAFGCDICNDVCPWNVSFAAPTERPEYQPRAIPDLTDPSYFGNMTEAEFDSRFADTPLERPGLSGMRRNWAIAFKAGTDES